MFRILVSVFALLQVASTQKCWKEELWAADVRAGFGRVREGNLGKNLNYECNPDFEENDDLEPDSVEKINESDVKLKVFIPVDGSNQQQIDKEAEDSLREALQEKDAEALGDARVVCKYGFIDEEEDELEDHYERGGEWILCYFY
ncbi:unnamed protein product [Cylicocyclus nassatus]|uniref:Uncharacterized protein n=1 Tax=Cylicocyclus nassatus TaxID=53992 RepID=A0AA36DNJ3_CYLNA|nr:unnamed protein product [Cylicocyclus nassatus]